MKQIRQIVTMRFLCEDFGYGDTVFDPGIVRLWADLATNYSMRSLLNMANRNFEVVYVVNDRIGRDADPALLAPLLKPLAELRGRICRRSELPSLVDEARASCDRLIVTRCDSDDLFHRDCVDEVQEAARSRPGSFVFGYDSGALFRVGSNVLRDFERTYPDGHMSAFQSVVYDCSDERLAGKTPYTWWHLNPGSELTKYGFSREEARAVLVKGDDAGKLPYVFVRHGMNGSHDGPEQDLRYPVLRGFPHDEFVRSFGVDVAYAEEPADTDPTR